LAPQNIAKVYATKEWIDANGGARFAQVKEVSDVELEKLSHLKTPNQAVAVMTPFESREPDGASFTLYLDTIQDPGNFGTMIRIADWFGIRDVVCSPGCADLYNPKVVQATMASIGRVNIYRDEGSDWLGRQKTPVYAATLDGAPLEQEPKTHEGILVIGNESHGISAEILRYAAKKITISKKGSAESLNAAVAAGIILSHLLS
jgi:TrmH family RNA methyltransferase